MDGFVTWNAAPSFLSRTEGQRKISGAEVVNGHLERLAQCVSCETRWRAVFLLILF
jgi:hypothetical protein